MADQCIVCLEDLDVVPDPSVHDDLREVAAASAELSTPHPSKTDNQQPIALIKPCGHVLHDECLREWSQKANSCPICRHTFNLVEVLDKVGGTVVSEYAVEDRKQVADFDPSAWIDDELEDEEESRPCPICGTADQEEVLLLCDSCDAPYHTHCVELDRVPEGHWFCMECESEGAYARAEEPLASQVQLLGRRNPRTQASVRRSRQRMRSDHWYGAWSIFSSRVHDVAGLDLDFSDDDQSFEPYRRLQRRAELEQRQFSNWQSRMRIAGNQGAGPVFRAAAPPRFRDRTPVTTQAPVESVEETKAWGAFEKAKEIDTTSPRNRKRKSRSITASPAEHTSPPREPERRLKRPRTRRVLDKPESSSASPVIAGPSRQANGHRSTSPSSRLLNTNGEPSFLSSLLKEVEMASTSDDDTSRSAFSATTTSGLNRVTSPSLDYSSPAASPASSSSYQTPRAMSVTPPPHITKRPGSPLPLTSRIEPIYPPADYSPSRSPPESNKPDHDQSSLITELRQPRPRRQRPVTLPRSQDTSPVRANMTIDTKENKIIRSARSQDTSPVRATMSIEAKEGINKIVKSALAPHWKSAEITKEQYADINRDVSRKLYEIVADRNINDEREKCAWEKIATAEVATAVKSLTA